MMFAILDHKKTPSNKTWSFFYDKNYFKNKGNLDCNFIIADNKEIRRQNMLRYFYASRHIFSYNKDFSLIDFIYTLEGHHIFMAPNFKTAIVSGLGRY